MTHKPNEIFLTARVGADAKTISFKFSPELYKEGKLKSKSVHVSVFKSGEEIGILEMTAESFDNFCLDLFNEHKKIMNNISI